MEKLVIQAIIAERQKKQRRNQSASGLEFAFNQKLQYICSNKSFL